MLEKRPLSAAYLAKAMPLADKAIRSLERKRFIVAEQVQTERDPLRAPVGPPARGTGRAGGAASPSSTSRSANCAPFWNCIRARTI